MTIKAEICVVIQSYFNRPRSEAAFYGAGSIKADTPHKSVRKPCSYYRYRKLKGTRLTFDRITLIPNFPKIGQLI